MQRRNFLKLCLLSLPSLSFAKLSLSDVIVENLKNQEDISLKEFINTKEKETDEDVLVSFLKDNVYERRSKLISKDTRRLHLYNPHTGETFKEIYYQNGKYKEMVIGKLNYFLRDFRENKTKAIDIELIDLVYSLQKSTSPEKPLVLLSGYRTEKTNRKLRKRGAAKNSFHIKGMAMDVAPQNNSIYKLNKLQKIAKNKKVGGVGYYRRSGFVHVDTGPVRTWS